MAMQLGQAGVNVNEVLAGRQQQQQQLPQQQTLQGLPQQQHQQQQGGVLQQPQRLPMGGGGAQGPPQGWQGQQAAALNPGSREFRPAQGLPPGARGMVRLVLICVCCVSTMLCVDVAAWSGDTPALRYTTCQSVSTTEAAATGCNRSMRLIPQKDRPAHGSNSPWICRRHAPSLPSCWASECHLQ